MVEDEDHGDGNLMTFREGRNVRNINELIFAAFWSKGRLLNGLDIE